MLPDVKKEVEVEKEYFYVNNTDDATLDVYFANQDLTIGNIFLKLVFL